MIRADSRQASPFFQAALKKQWKEGKERKFTLPEDDVQTVNTYLNFIYTGTISCKALNVDNTNDHDVHAAEATRLAKMYVFGEKYQDVQLKNAVIEAVVAMSRVRDEKGIRWLFTGPEVDILYKGTVAGSLAHRLMVEMHLAHGSGRWLEGETNNGKFAIDLAREMMWRKLARDLNRRMASEYEGDFDEKVDGKVGGASLAIP